MEKVGWPKQMVPAEGFLAPPPSLPSFLLSYSAFSIQVIQWNTIEVVSNGHPQIHRETES